MARTGQADTPHRQRLLRAGDRLFYERGYHGASLDAVLAEAGAPKGSFYYHFASKEAFVAAVLERYAESRLRLLNRWLDRTDLDVVEQVTAYHHELVGRFDESGWTRACLAGKLANEVAWSSQSTREQLASVFGTSKEVLRTALEEGQARGEVRDDIPASALAEAVQAIVQGGLVAALALRDRPILDELTDALNTLLRGNSLSASRTAELTVAGQFRMSIRESSSQEDTSRLVERRPRSHRDSLLREGLHQIFMNGCHGTSVDRLLRDSGVPKGSFYHHFRSRAAFFSAVLKRYGAFHRTRLNDWQQRENLSTADRVSGYYRDLVAIFVRSGYLNSDLSAKIATEFAATSDPLREQVGENMRVFLELLERVLADGKGSGDVGMDQSARQIAITVHALIVGSFLLAQAHRDEQALEEIACVIASVISSP